eukprot:2590847-Prymnesium_polylepis.1
MMRDLGGRNTYHPYTAYTSAFCARKSRYYSSYSLARCLRGTAAAVHGGVRQHHGAASAADRAAETATVPWPYGPRRAPSRSNTRTKSTFLP